MCCQIKKKYNLDSIYVFGTYFCFITFRDKPLPIKVTNMFAAGPSSAPVSDRQGGEQIGDVEERESVLCESLSLDLQQ